MNYCQDSPRVLDGVHLALRGGNLGYVASGTWEEKGEVVSWEKRTTRECMLKGKIIIIIIAI
jgi:hypothetical protein